MTPTDWRGLITQAAFEGLIPLPQGVYHWGSDELVAEGQRVLAELQKNPNAEAVLRRAYHRPRERKVIPQFRSARYVRPSVLNCIYHVCPLKSNDLWRRNVQQLLTRADVFTGKRVAAIAVGEGCHPPAVVKDAFAGSDFQFLELPTVPDLREVVSFLPLLLTVNSYDLAHATFYAHTKGNSTDESVQGSIYWRNAAYHHLLDRADDCMQELETHAAVGIHKMVWPSGQAPYPTGLQHGRWMLAGTFFWFRNCRVFTHPKWRQIPMDRYGAESWLGGLFEPHEGASVYQLWPESEYPTPNPYDPDLYPDPIDDA